MNSFEEILLDLDTVEEQKRETAFGVSTYILDQANEAKCYYDSEKNCDNCGYCKHDV